MLPSDERPSRSNSSHIALSNSDLARTKWWWALFLIVLIFQVAIALALWKTKNGMEFSSDMHTYQDYVQQPGMLFHSMEHQDTTGGGYAPPVLPLMLYIPHFVFSQFGDDFLAFRFTMIAWVMLGLGLALDVALKDFGVPENRKQALGAILLVLLPVVWMAPAVLSQDDSVAAGWSGICVWAWRRWGVWGCVITALLAFWIAKVFFILALLGLWMSYPKLRTKLVVIGIAFLALVAGLVMLRDGSFEYVSKGTPPYMGGTVYAIYYILFLDSSKATQTSFGTAARNISFLPTVIGLGSWALLGMRKTLSLPVAIVGTYSLFFVTFCGMMPEFELWYFAWVLLILWSVMKNGDRLTFAVGWMHSFWGYFYKICYSSDRFIFYKGSNKSALQDFFQTNFDFDLKGLLVFTASATVLSGLLFAIRLYWRDPTASVYRSIMYKPQIV
jgi:hypothetical protein